MVDIIILNEVWYNDLNNRYKWKLRWVDVGVGGNFGFGFVVDVFRVSFFIFLFLIKY